MNAPIIDPLQGDFPEVIEEFLEHGAAKCIAFNRRGTLLAAGCADGSCVIWDFETRGVAKVLRDKDCVIAITSICWSKYGHKILVSALDNSLTLWDVVKGERVTRIALKQLALQARLHPSSSPATCLVCSVSSAPMIVDLSTGDATLLPVSFSESSTNLAPPSRGKSSDVPFTPPTAACFSKYGDLVYVGNSKGEILIIDYRSIQIRGIISVPGGSMIKNIIFSRNGRYLLTNSNDRTVRIYENLLPLKDGIKALDELKKNGVEALKSDLDEKMKDEQDELEKLKATGLKCLSLFREFQDSITRVHWKAPCFSGDGEWVIGGSASLGEHKIYIWDQAGYLVKILEGPREKLIDLAWHPVHPIIVSVSLPGQIYIWAKDYTENWSAFAPDFKELEENEEYVEREDEFDLVTDNEKGKELDVNENDEIDIMTVEKDAAFSDSDTSVDEICFLPSDPIPDPPEQHDKCVGSTSKLAESTQSDSLLSEEAGQNGHAVDHSSSPHEGLYNSAEDTGGSGLKRQLNLSDKVSGSQADKVKKPSKKFRPSGK